MPKQRPKDEIRDDIAESLQRRNIKDESLLRELMLTFAHWLGIEKAHLESSHYAEQERERIKREQRGA